MRNIFFPVKAIHLRIPMRVSLFFGSVTLPALAVDLDPQRVGGYDTSGSAYGVAVSGNYAYVADGDAGLQVIASNPANPQRVGGYDTSGFLANGVAVSGNYAYVADWDAGLQVIDVSNPANPQRVGGYDTSGTALPLANWTPLGYVTQFSLGQYRFTDLQATNHPQRYYRISSP